LSSAFRKTRDWDGKQEIRIRVLSWNFIILGLMNGANSFPMWDFIMLVRWSRILSSFGKLSASSPRILELSSIPISRYPPDVFRNAVRVFRTLSSIFLSVCFV